MTVLVDFIGGSGHPLIVYLSPESPGNNGISPKKPGFFVERPIF